MRPTPYCSPAMLRMLKRAGREELITVRTPDDKVTVANLMSRGWLTRTGYITQAGRKYLEAHNG